mmetsp:Transcript_73082/g.236562  ORF Transcript_73082/g.236562 Transcript_73082/m.236562 type:complete len:217 (-) Transcript_73082:562-1212(-)
MQCGHQCVRERRAVGACIGLVGEDALQRAPSKRDFLQCSDERLREGAPLAGVSAVAGRVVVGWRRRRRQQQQQQQRCCSASSPQHHQRERRHQRVRARQQMGCGPSPAGGGDAGQTAPAEQRFLLGGHECLRPGHTVAGRRSHLRGGASSGARRHGGLQHDVARVLGGPRLAKCSGALRLDAPRPRWRPASRRVELRLDDGRLSARFCVASVAAVV